MIGTIAKNISKNDTSKFTRKISFHPNFVPYPK